MPRWSRLVARLIPFYEFDNRRFFRSDGAPPTLPQAQDGFFRLAGLYQERFAKGQADDGCRRRRESPTCNHRGLPGAVQYRPAGAEHLGTARSCSRPAGVTVTDVDGNVFDESDRLVRASKISQRFYKECIARAEARAHALGPVLGPTIPVRRRQCRAAVRDSGSTRSRSTCSGTEA